MRNYFLKNKFLWLTFGVALIVLFYFYHTVLLAPNDFLFSAEGDGIKNYYTYLYHAQYDTQFGHFSGMNYPYYEHVVYTDAHPLFSYLIGQLALANYGVGILNVLMLLSYPIAAVFIFKIFRQYKVNDWWALAAAVAITFLSPQIFRLTGHFAMSYVFAVPIMWWLLIKSYSTKKWIWSVIISLYMLAFFFTHPYLGIILAFFSIVFWLVNMVKSRKEILPGIARILIQTALPLVLFQGYISMTDVHVDRLSNPAGFFHYYATWNSLIIPHHGPIREITSFFSLKIGEWETWCYIGFPTIVFAVIIGIQMIRMRAEFHLKSFLKKELSLFLIAAYLILLFSFCFPLKYDWLRWVTDLFGPLKQFRILGRFTWIFFYVFTVTCAIGIYRLYQKKQHKAYPILFFTGILFYLLEFAPAHSDNANYMTIADNKFLPEKVDANMNEVIDFVKKENYDAILFLPFQHMSSENIMLLGAHKANYDAFLLSYHTQTPLVNSISSRMSFTESIKVNNYFSPRFIEKELTYDFPVGDRIVVIKNRDLLKPSELVMIWESEQVFENEEFVIFDFDPAKYNSRAPFDRIMAKEKLATQTVGQGWKSDTTDVWFYYESFDDVGLDLPAEHKLGGTGAFRDLKSSWNTIKTFDQNTIPPGDYVIKYWYYLREDRPDPLAVMEAKYVQEDSSAWIAQFDIKQSTLIVEDWCLVEMNFTVSPDVEELNVLITGNSSQEPFIIDELLIQRQNDPHLFRKAIKNDNPYVIYDNYWIKENSFE